MSKEIVVWKDPPASRGRGRPGKYPELLAELIANPKRWAFIKTHDTPNRATAQQAYLSRVTRERFGGLWEIVTRISEEGNGHRDVFARYLGPDSNGVA